jgi:hypothetical protein
MFAILAACTPSSTDSSKPGGAANPDTSSGPNGNGNGNGNGASTGPGAGTTVTKSGTVSLVQSKMTILDKDYSSYTASATFIQATSYSSTVSSTGCTTSTDGDCSIVDCDASNAVVSDAGAPPAADAGAPQGNPSAGDITVTGDKEIVLSPNAAGVYAPKTEQVSLWTAGNDLAVKAKGADIPAFDKTLKAPGAITLTAPEWPTAPGQAVAIDRSADLDLAWTDGGDGDVSASISSVAGKKTTFITCTFKAAGGTGKITKAALGKLQTTTTGTISLLSTASDIVDAAGWKVTVSASSPASTSAGGAASGIANIN